MLFRSHGSGHPGAGRGGVAVRAAETEVRVAPVILIQNLSVVDAGSGHFGNFAGNDFFCIFAHGTQVISPALAGADMAVQKLLLRRQAEAAGIAFFFNQLFIIVFCNEVALLGKADTMIEQN